jgi:glucosamine--fructose-6-phosphate aminotransferase (isomerizing)
MTILLSEIHEQPDVLCRLLAQESDHVEQIAAQIRARHPRYVLIAARGTSDNAARYAQYLFGARNRLAVMLAAPALYTRYHAPPRMDDALVIGISQSGASPDLVAVIEEGKRQGCATLAITNGSDSPMARVADDVILLHADTEKSVAATKTYTAQLMVLAMFSAALAQSAEAQAQLARVADQMVSVLNEQTVVMVERAAQSLKHAEDCVVIGRGYNFSTANELALKAKELAYVAAEPYSAADFLHGPIALIDEGYPAVVVNLSGKVFEEVQEVLSEIKRRGAKTAVISDQEESLALADAPIALPSGIPEWLSPIIAIVPGQLLAFHLSRARGFDPDQPRGIQKVTRTM